MPVQVLSGPQAGLTVNDIIQIIADDWGYNPSNDRIKNMIVRRINRALRDFALFNPKLRIFRVVGADANLIVGQREYIVTDTEANGGFGWDSCREVLELVFNVIDNRPLEKMSLEQFRERSELLEHTGTPESWFAIDATRVYVFPTPDSAYAGVGDYLSEIPSITAGTAQLGWPRSWDEALMAGVEYHVAKVRLRENPRAIREYERNFKEKLMQIEEIEHVTPNRPQQAMVTRHMRSRRTIPTDNSTDVRYWR